MLRRMLIRGMSVPINRPSVIIIRPMATRLKDYTSYYDILEVSGESTKTEIREAWLKLSMLYHPDLNKDNPEANEKFMEIKEAYTTLINDEKRKAYNNKIGFYHSDPPPDFQREWTMEGEMERSGAAAYHVMWSEEAIRKLMGSQKLRDMNWHKMTPSERYKVLEEEKKKQYSVKAELERTETLSLKVGSDRYWVMVGLIAIVSFFAYLLERREGDQLHEPSIDEQMFSKKNVLINGKQYVHFTARTDKQSSLDRSVFDNPYKPFSGEIGYRESFALPEQDPRSTKSEISQY